MHRYREVRSRTDQLALKQMIEQLDREDRWDELETLAKRMRESSDNPDVHGLSLLHDALRSMMVTWLKKDDVAGYVDKRKAWLKRFTRSVLAHELVADAYILWGLRARGVGYANTVSEVGWRLLKDRVGMADQYFKAAEKLPERDAMLYASRLDVALYMQWPRAKAEQCFIKAIEIDDTLPDAYNGMVIYLLPRWNGQPGDIARFADRYTWPKNKRMYVAIVREAYDHELENVFTVTQMPWPRVKEAFEEMVRDCPNDRQIQSYYAALACIAQDKTTARRLFQLYGPWLDERYFEPKGSFEQYRNWAMDWSPQTKKQVRGATRQ